MPRLSFGGQLFLPKQEQLLLLLPFIIFLAVIVELAWPIQHTADEKSFGLFAAQFIFLNHIHVFFSFFILLSVPEIKRWATEKREDAPNVISQLVFVMSMAYLYFCVVIPYLKTNWAESNAATIGLTISMLISTHHNFIQSLGLSIAYNRIFEAHQPEKQIAIRNVERWERLFAKLMMAATLAQYAITLLEKRSILDNWFNVATALSVVSFAACIGALVFAFRTPQPSDRAKSLYTVRYLLIPAFPYSNYALWGMLSLHGIEYLMVVQKIRRQSQNQSLPSVRKVAIGVACMAAFLPLKILQEQFISAERAGVLFGSDWFLTYIVPITLVISYGHFFLDSLLFRFSNPRTRQMMAPLLLSRSDNKVILIRN